MSKYVYISNYFRYENSSRTDHEYNRVNKIREEIDSFKDESDALKYIYERRLDNFNREEDRKLFGIPVDFEVDESLFNFHNNNRYYNGINPNKRFDYYKKDKKGNTILDRNGLAKQHGKIGKAGINFANNMKNSKAGNAVKFIISNIHAILVILASILAAIIALFLIVYLYGTANSLGHTPFVLCGQDEITGGQSVQLGSAAEAEMVSPDYVAKAFVYVAKEHGWKNEAIVGALSYILQEGAGMGTFTYEGYYMYKGPSGIIMDKTLDNKKWLDWLSSEGKEQAHNGYYKGGAYYASIGLGILQESDVWRNDGSMDDTGASDMIKYADSKDKPWQDPETQLNYCFEVKFSKQSAFDDDGSDPTSSSYSAEEWCKRVSAGIGMPAWRWNDSSHDSYYNDHLKHLDEANSYLKEYTGISLSSLKETTSNKCARANHIISGGNSTIADAAVTLAGSDVVKIPWDEDGLKSKNLNEDGLKNYKSVKSNIFNGDEIYASCDRSVSAAVRWSGADDNFPMGDTEAIYNYLKNQDNGKWTYVGDYGKCDLIPGDVLITKGNGHVKIYVGNQAAQVKYPGTNSDMYAGSYHDYFPRLYKDDAGYDSREYAVFRNANPDNSSKYKDANK